MKRINKELLDQLTFSDPTRAISLSPKAKQSLTGKPAAENSESFPPSHINFKEGSTSLVEDSILDDFTQLDQASREGAGEARSGRVRGPNATQKASFRNKSQAVAATKPSNKSTQDASKIHSLY